MSAELRLILFPMRTYAALARRPSPLGPIGALRRPLLVAIVIGAGVSILATGRAPLGLVASTTAMWSIAVLLQIAIALAVVAGPARRTIGVSRALDLFFAGHAPWSLFILGIAAWMPDAAVPSLRPLLIGALLPLVLTPRIINAYFRQVLRLDRREALLRTIGHQALTWTVLLVLYGAAIAAVPRIVQRFG